MINRKIINDLLNWKRKHVREALLIKGARQVGKTKKSLTSLVLLWKYKMN